MKHSLYSRIVIPGVVAGLFTLVGCGGGGGGSNLSAKGNLRVTSLAIVSPDPTSAHELDLETGVLATRAMQNVSISYYVIHKGELDKGVAEPTQFLVETHLLDTVSAGDHKYPVTIIIPKEVGPKGAFYLTTRVDPLNQIDESDEEDNVPPEDAPDIVIQVNHDNLNTPDFTIESVTLDDPAIVLTKHVNRRSVGSVRDRREHHAGATALFQVTGAKDHGAVSVRCSIEVPGIGDRNLTIWREDQNRYVTTFYSEIVPGQPGSVHIDLNIPDTLRTTLVNLVKQGTKNFKIKFALNVGNSIAEWENGVLRIKNRTDDEVIVPVVLIDPATIPSTACLKYEQGFGKKWTNKYLGVGVGFHAGAYLDGRGAVAEAEGSIPVSIFRKKFEFFRGQAYGQLAPHQPSETQFHVEVDLLGLTVYRRASSNPTYTYTDTPFKKVETIEKKSIVFVGPVPIVFQAGAEGELGYRLTFAMNSGSMRLTGTPYAKLEARASGVVELGVARGGARLAMTLLSDEFAVSSTFGNVRLANAGTSLSASLNTNVTNTLEGPRGRIWLFVDYPGVKWCKTFLGRVPCGLKNIHREKTLVKFKTFKKVDVLLNETITRLVMLNCK